MLKKKHFYIKIISRKFPTFKKENGNLREQTLVALT